MIRTATKIEFADRDLKALEAKIAKLETGIAAVAESQRNLNSSQSRIGATVDRVERHLIRFVGLTDDEQDTIRGFLGIKRLPGATKLAVGDLVGDAKPLPDELIAKVPRLAGLRFAIDPGSGAALIVNADSRVVAAIEARG